jgi:hypothetical protein
MSRLSGQTVSFIPPALVGYQTVQDLLSDALLVLGGDTFVAPFLNGRKPMLEGVHYCLEVRSCLSILPFRFVPV